MRLVLLLPFACLAACSGGGNAGNANAVDVDAAANRAQRDIANYAANTPQPTPTPAATLSPQPTPAPDPSAGPAPAASDGGEAAAADVVRAYAAALSEGHYRQAWLMWRGGGEASGMSADAFAASFRKYATIRGTVGVPYDADAGAGQRYVTVPLTLAGDLRQGGRFMLAGPVVLHRVADGIETNDPADHRWQIDSTSLKPRPTGTNAASQ